VEEVSAATLPEGFTLARERVTWLWTDDTGRARKSHPWQWKLTEPDGYTRFYDTRADALADVPRLAGE